MERAMGDTSGTGGDADSCVIALDVGGTRIKAGIIDSDARVLADVVVDTAREDGPEAVADRLTGVLDNLTTEAGAMGRTPVAAGVAMPGIVDEGAGRVVFSANVGWRDFELGDHLTKRSGLPAAVGHDVRAGGLAEWRLGAGRGASDLLFLPIGTGIAGAMILDGRPYAAGGYAGEIGHVRIDPGGDRCGCGGRGCLETVSSAAAIARRYSRRRVHSGPIGAADVARAAASGEPLAREIWQRAVDGLVTALHMYVSVCAPHLIVIGGGLSECGEVLLEPLREQLTSRLTFQRRPEIVRAGLGDRAGLLGAALLAWRAVSP
jgi:glucokinase